MTNPSPKDASSTSSQGRNDQELGLAQPKSNSKPPSRTRTYLRLLQYIKPYWWAIALTIVGFGINSATEIGIAKLIQFITDAINDGTQSELNLFPFLIILLFFIRGVGSFLGSLYWPL